MELLAIGLLSTLALAFVVYPLLNPRRYLYYLDDLLGSRDEIKLSFLHARKRLVFDNIKDLDFEHEMGKLAEDDYVRLRNDLMREAEDAVKDIDQAKIRRDIDEEIEKEVRSRRRTK